MKLTLPYNFNTAKRGILLFKGVVAVVGIMLILIFKYILFTRSFVAVLLLTVPACVIAYVGFIIFKSLRGSVGSISATEIAAEPVSFIGVMSSCPYGTYPLTRFKGLRVEIVLGSADGKIVPHERVILEGDGKVPDFMIAWTPLKEGVALATELGPQINLPVSQVRKSS